jgi:putative transcriptional regulator
MMHGTGPKDNMIVMGYSGWLPMQMERELLENRWLLVDSDPELIFKTPDEWKWERAMDESKIDLTRFIASTGSA